MDTEEIAKISIERFAEQLGKAEAVLFWHVLAIFKRKREAYTSRLKV